MAAAIPWNDWQFWVATLAALGAALWILRGLWPRRKRAGTRVALTIKRTDHERE